MNIPKMTNDVGVCLDNALQTATYLNRAICGLPENEHQTHAFLSAAMQSTLIIAQECTAMKLALRGESTDLLSEDGGKV